MKKTEPSAAPQSRKIAPLPTEKGRERNSRIGNIGAGARSSQATNATKRRDARRKRHHGLEAAPADRVAAHKRPDDPVRAARDEREARDIERGVRPEALRRFPARRRPPRAGQARRQDL